MGNYEKISDARDQLDVGRYGSEMEEYNSGYITDIYMEIADNNTSIYYYDIERYLVDNVDDVNDWIDENGWPGDLYKAAQGAEYDSIYRELLENSEDILLYYTYTYVLENYSEELEELDNLDDDYIYNNVSLNMDRLECFGETVDELVDELIEEKEEEQE